MPIQDNRGPDYAVCKLSAGTDKDNSAKNEEINGWWFGECDKPYIIRAKKERHKYIKIQV